MTGILLAVSLFTSAITFEAPPALTGVRILLPDGQQLTGRLLALDKETLTIRTAWAEKLSLPRASVTAIVQLPGSIVLAEDDFREGLKGCKVVGKPAFGDKGVSFSDSTQALSYTPSPAVAIGSVVLAFRDGGEAAGARWTCDLAFAAKDKEQTLSVVVAGAGASYEIMAGGMKGTALKVARKPGWHRLTVRFSPRSIRVMIDDDLIWFNADEGPGGPLQRVELACRADKDAKVKGSVIWSTFAFTKAIDEIPHPSGDGTQDELWLTTGDQFFGTITHADRSSVEFQGRAGKRSIPWAELRGCYLRQTSISPLTTTGEHVRLVLHSSLSKNPDLLNGLLVQLDDKRALLRHARLGEIGIDRVHIKELNRLFKGSLREIDTGFHHLGDKDTVVGDWPAPKAEATKWSGRITLDVAPTLARLVVRVWPLPRGLEAGSRTEVVVNGERVGYLEGRAGLVTLSLPRGLLKVGENTLEINCTLGRVGKARGPCGFSGVVLELPE